MVLNTGLHCSKTISEDAPCCFFYFGSSLGKTPNLKKAGRASNIVTGPIGVQKEDDSTFDSRHAHLYLAIGTHVVLSSSLDCRSFFCVTAQRPRKDVVEMGLSQTGIVMLVNIALACACEEFGDIVPSELIENSTGATTLIRRRLRYYYYSVYSTPGFIAGIVIGSLVLVAFVIAMIILIARRRRRMPPAPILIAKPMPPPVQFTTVSYTAPPPVTYTPPIAYTATTTTTSYNTLRVV